MYTYDKTGNRLSKDSVTYTVNTVNEVTALSDGTTFMYDSNGNRIQKTTGTDTLDYTYDFANRLTKVEKNDVTLGEYVYDGSGRRIQVTEPSDTTTSIYSGMNVLYEENTTGRATYIYGPTGRIAKRTTINQESNTFYYHTDHANSTRLITDSDKNIIAAAAYTPFGGLSVEEGSENYLYTGKEQDATDLYYFGARYYDPDIGRFITRDPLTGTPATPQTLNRYAYCANNPLKYTDATGLSYSFVDEELENELNGEESTTVHGSEPLIIQIDDDKYMVYDMWGQSGNVVVGYGYVMSYSGNTAHLETGPVLCVVEFDDDGNVKNKEYWEAKDVDKWDAEKFVYELDYVVSDESLQDLSNALNGLRKAIADKLEVPWWQPVATGAAVGFGAGYITSGGGIHGIPPAVLSALVGALIGAGESLIRWAENNRWQERNNFLADLFIDNLGETKLPPPL
jgi:RHS repeat-associated protein